MTDLATQLLHTLVPAAKEESRLAAAREAFAVQTHYTSVPAGWVFTGAVATWTHSAFTWTPSNG